MTDTPQKRLDAKAKYSAIAARVLQTLLDKATAGGYYGQETLTICASDGVITHILQGHQQTHKN